jgi:hypothetical protein
MSAVGFDVGNDVSCVALARKRGIDVLLNKESKRETPAMISFGDKMRYMGVDAYGKISMKPKDTVHQLKRLIGKRFDDPAVQADIAKLPFKVLAAPDGGVVVQVQYLNEPATFTPEQLVAMVLVDLKRIAEEEGGVPVTDCCLSVPAYFTEAERYGMLNAASIAGVNCLRLINETTATALAYGIYKSDLPDTEPVHVAFVDVGHSATQVGGGGGVQLQVQLQGARPAAALAGRMGLDATAGSHASCSSTGAACSARGGGADGPPPLQSGSYRGHSLTRCVGPPPGGLQVSVVSLKRTGLAVRSHAWERNLGGRDFDEVRARAHAPAWLQQVVSRWAVAGGWQAVLKSGGAAAGAVQPLCRRVQGQDQTGCDHQPQGRLQAALTVREGAAAGRLQHQQQRQQPAIRSLAAGRAGRAGRCVAAAGLGPPSPPSCQCGAHSGPACLRSCR